MSQNQKTLFAPQPKASWSDWFNETAGTVALLLIVGSMPQPLFPEWASWAGISLLAINFIVGFSREFIRGVNDAGGWTNNSRVKPPAPTPDAKLGPNCSFALLIFMFLGHQRYF